MPEPGRNDPCPCGSGQKYKKCCLPKAEAALDAQRPRLARGESVMPKLLRFAYSPQFDSDHDVARLLFWADLLNEMDPDDADELIGSDDAEVKYNAWFVWDLDIEEGRTVADLFLEQKGRSLDPAERAYLERMRRSSLALHQVEAVEPGRGVLLRNLLTRDTVFVHERLGSGQIVRSDLLGARVVLNEAGVPMFEGGLYLYGVADKGALVADLKRYRRNYRRRFPGVDDVRFLKRHGMVFNYWWLERVVLRPLPRMTTVDGDEMVFAKSVFDVADPAALRAALDAASDVAADDEDGAYTWGEETSDFRRILATLRLEGDRLTVETMSRSRDVRCREWLAAVAPGATFRATALETVAAAMERVRTTPAPENAGDLNPDVKSTIEREMLDAHYRRWIDEAVPALAGATPRAAAASRKLRPLLIDLLREFDNRHERAIRHGGQAYDTSWLWSELGLR